MYWILDLIVIGCLKSVQIYPHIMLIKKRYMLIFFWWLLSTFCPRGQRGRYVKCPRLTTWGEWGVKIGSNLVHIVVEWPLTRVCKTPNIFKNPTLNIYSVKSFKWTFLSEPYFFKVHIFWEGLTNFKKSPTLDLIAQNYHRIWTYLI